MRLRVVALAAAVALAAGGIAQDAWADSVTFYTDRAGFEAALTSSTTIDFEGIVGDTAYGTPEGGLRSSTTIGGVEFSVASVVLGVSGTNGAVAGAPYNSALLFSNNDGAITADLMGLTGPVTAVGAWFGDIYNASSTTLTLTGTSGVLDLQTVTAGDMGLGSQETFYGWIVSGYEIASVTHSTFGTGSNWEGIDDFVYGVGSTQPVPEPTTLVLFGLGLAGFAARRRKARASV